MISAAPTHSLCAEAYYWLALAAKKSGDRARCVDFATKVQTAQGSQPGLLSEWRLDCQANLLRSNLKTGTRLQSINYSLEFQKACLANVEHDLGMF